MAVSAIASLLSLALVSAVLYAIKYRRNGTAAATLFLDTIATSTRFWNEIGATTAFLG